MEIEKPIHMRVLAEDLSTYLKSSSDPLGVLKTINSLPGTSWDFQIRLSDKTAPELLITLPNGVAYSDLLDGTIPELHWCSKILIS